MSAYERRGADEVSVDGQRSNPLEYLCEAKRSLTAEKERICDDLVIGLLSIHVPEQVWKDAVEMAVRLASKKSAHG